MMMKPNVFEKILKSKLQKVINIINKFNFKLLLLPLIAVLLSGCFARLANKNIDNNPIKYAYNGAELSVDEIAQGIMLAGENSDWTMQRVNKNLIEASLLVRNKHLVKVDISFDARNYHVHYKSSNNMDYDGNNIHPNYYVWLKQLVQDINLYLATV